MRQPTQAGVHNSPWVPYALENEEEYRNAAMEQAIEEVAVEVVEAATNVSVSTPLTEVTTTTVTNQAALDERIIRQFDPKNYYEVMNQNNLGILFAMSIGTIPGSTTSAEEMIIHKEPYASYSRPGSFQITNSILKRECQRGWRLNPQSPESVLKCQSWMKPRFVNHLLEEKCQIKNEEQIQYIMEEVKKVEAIVRAANEEAADANARKRGGDKFCWTTENTVCMCHAWVSDDIKAAFLKIGRAHV